MNTIFSHYFRLQKCFSFHTKMQAIFLVLNGVFLSILELVGVTAIFPVMMIVLYPTRAKQNALLGKLYQLFHFQSDQHFAIFLVLIVIFLLMIKVIAHLLLWRYEFSLLNKWRVKIVRHIFSGLMYADLQKINSKSSATFINVMTSVVPYVIANYVLQCINLLKTLILAVLIFACMIYVNFSLFLSFCIVGVSLVGSFLYFQRKRARELGGDVQRLSESLMATLQQSIAGFKETKIYQKETFFSKKCNDIATRIAKVDLSLLLNEHLPTVLVEFFVMLTMFGGFAILLWSMDSIQSAAALMSMVVILGVRMVPFVNRAITSLWSVRSSIEPLHQLLEVYDVLFPEGKTFESPEHRDVTISFKHMIALHNLSFCYPGDLENCLKDINLEIQKGSHIGIVGPSGSGKTTLINILLGFLSQYQGAYTIDGKTIAGDAIYGMRKLTSFVDQQPFLLDGDYIANVAYGVEKDKVDKERIIQCLRDVGLWGHISSLKHGLESAIGENGKYLSGGQRQRLVIARALYYGTEILILDEASSALDMESEALLIDLLDNLGKDITIISIAHRLSTLRKCDRIVFMEDGRIVSEGTFKKLYQKNDIFKRYVDHSVIEV